MDAVRWKLIVHYSYLVAANQRDYHFT